MKEKIRKILTVDRGVVYGDFPGLIADLEALFNQEVERRIKERMPSKEDVMIYFDRNSNCVAKSIIKIPAMTRSAVLIMAEWFRNRMKGER